VYTVDQPRIIFEQANPYETFAATVEEDGRTVYLYLSPLKDASQSPKAVWIRNLLPAPDESDRDAMQQGIAPLMKKSACAHPDGLAPPPQAEIGILWFQEGNGVVLYLNGIIAAVIPPWSGKEGFYGYSAEAIAADAGTLPLSGETGGLFDRIVENERFWENRNDPAYWNNYRDALLAHYTNAYGNYTRYFAVTGRNYPMIGIAQFQHDDLTLYATVGMSFQNMPAVELAKKEPEAFLRTEILTARLDEIEWLPGLIGRMALYPWLYNRHLDATHTYESGMQHPYSDFIFTDRFEPEFLPDPGEFFSERYPVRFLTALPLLQEDLLVARAKGPPFLLEQITRKASPAFRWP